MMMLGGHLLVGFNGPHTAKFVGYYDHNEKDGYDEDGEDLEEEG